MIRNQAPSAAPQPGRSSAVTTTTPTVQPLRMGRGVIIFVTLLGTLGLVFAYGWFTEGEALFSARFSVPWALIGLLAVPWLLWRGTLGEDRRTVRLRVGSLTALRQSPVGLKVHLRDVPGTLRAIGFGLLVVALARPMDTQTSETADESGIDLMVVLDLSGSMQAVMENLPTDLRPYLSRLAPGVPPARVDAAKAVIRDFIARRKTDRIGAIVFGSEAYVLAPPTLDYQLLDQLVASMRLQMINEGATAIGDAVGAAVARLRKSSARSKAIILLTDGDSNAGRVSPSYAADLAVKAGAKVFTVQIGDGRMSKVYAGQSLLGQPRFVSREFPVNPQLLQALAKRTGATSYVATDAKALQASLHDVLDQLEKSRLQGGIARFRELFPLWLLPGVVLLSLEALLRSFVLRRFP